MANGLNLDELRRFLGQEAEAGRGDVFSPGGQATFGGPFRRDLTISLDPDREAAFGAAGRTARSLGEAGETMAARIRRGGLDELSFGGLPGVGGLRTEDLESRLTSGVGEEGRRRVEDSIFQRGINLLQPGQEEETRRAREELAARGIPEGSAQGQRILDDVSRRQGANRENLALSSIAGGGQEQSRQFADLLAGSQFGLAGRGATAQSELASRGLLGSERAASFQANDPLARLAQVMGLSQFQQPVVPQPQGLSFSSAVQGSRPGNVGAFEQGGLGRDLLVGGLSGFGQVATGAARSGNSFFDLFG